MPLLDSTLAQVVFAFVMIGLFALILRWTFSSGTRDRHVLPDSATDSATDSAAESATDSAVSSGSSSSSSPAADPAVANGSPKLSPSAASARPPAVLGAPSSEDYGLLVPAGAMDSLDEAHQARALLSQAGIRATTTVGADGRHRVLVFTRDLHRARRLITRRPAP